jgi:hypothetical protein
MKALLQALGDQRQAPGALAPMIYALIDHDVGRPPAWQHACRNGHSAFGAALSLTLEDPAHTRRFGSNSLRSAQLRASRTVTAGDEQGA